MSEGCSVVSSHHAHSLGVVWVICRVYRDTVPHPSRLQQLLIGVQKRNQGHRTAGAHAGRVNQKAGTTALGSWPETPG